MSIAELNDFAVDATTWQATLLAAKPLMAWQATTDREAGLPREQKTNGNGAPLWEAVLLVVEDGYPKQAVVNVPKDITDITPGTPVKLSGLRGHYWVAKDKKRSSLTFRCEDLAVLK